MNKRGLNLTHCNTLFKSFSYVILCFSSMQHLPFIGNKMCNVKKILLKIIIVCQMYCNNNYFLLVNHIWHTIQLDLISWTLMFNSVVFIKMFKHISGWFCDVLHKFTVRFRLLPFSLCFPNTLYKNFLEKARKQNFVLKETERAI